MAPQPRWFASDHRRTICASDGASIAVWDSGGDGTPVVLVHGFPENHLAWSAVLAELGGPDPSVRYIAYDLRGHGESDKRGEASWQRLLQDHFDVVAALELPPYHLVGHDWGGAIALHVAGYRPQTLASLVVLNTNFWETDVRGMWHMTLLNLPAVAALLFRFVPDLVYRAFVTRTLSDAAAIDPAILEAYRRMFHHRETTAFWIRLYRNMALGLVRQRLPAFAKSRIATSRLPLPRRSKRAFQVETLLIWGADDTFNPVWVGRGIERRLGELGAGVRFELVPQAHHFVPEDAPAVVAGHVRAHLSRLQPPRPN